MRIHHLSGHNYVHTKTISSTERTFLAVLNEIERTERYLGSPSTIPYAIIVCENEAVSNARNGIFVKIFKNGVSINFGRSLKIHGHFLTRDSGR